MAIIAKFNIYNSKYLIYMIIWYNNSKIKIIINYMQKKKIIQNEILLNSFKSMKKKLFDILTEFYYKISLI